MKNDYQNFLKTFLFVVIFFCSSTSFSRISFVRVALADPPSWAPAHGYREKHGEHDHERHDHDRDDEDRDRHHEKEPSQWRDRVEVVSRYEEVFRRLDFNHDGRISQKEWQEGVDFFNRLDKNHDGVLTRGEYDHIDEQRGLISGFFHRMKEKLDNFWAKLF